MPCYAGSALLTACFSSCSPPASPSYRTSNQALDVELQRQPKGVHTLSAALAAELAEAVASSSDDSGADDAEASEWRRRLEATFSCGSIAASGPAQAKTGLSSRAGGAAAAPPAARPLPHSNQRRRAPCAAPLFVILVVLAVAQGGQPPKPPCSRGSRNGRPARCLQLPGLAARAYGLEHR